MTTTAIATGAWSSLSLRLTPTATAATALSQQPTPCSPWPPEQSRPLVSTRANRPGIAVHTNVNAVAAAIGISGLPSWTSPKSRNSTTVSSIHARAHAGTRSGPSGCGSPSPTNFPAAPWPQPLHEVSAVPIEGSPRAGSRQRHPTQEERRAVVPGHPPCRAMRELQCNQRKRIDTEPGKTPSPYLSSQTPKSTRFSFGSGSAGTPRCISNLLTAHPL